MYWREDSFAASRMFYKAWTLSKVRMLPLLCAFLAAGLGLVRIGQKRA
jgi:hypothetical protein